MAEFLIARPVPAICEPLTNRATALGQFLEEKKN